MNRNFVKTRLILMATGIALLSASGHLLNGAEATITRTNWAERWITNVVDILMPRNIFIDEYHTNWIEQWRTNVVNRYATNIIPIAAVRTNVVHGYRTNWATLTFTNEVRVDAFHTNLIKAYRTNWKTLELTKMVPVNLVQTNFITQYETNLKTLNLTNWETVLVMKTNWFTQPVTNVVQLDLKTNHFIATEVGATKAVHESKAARVTGPASTSIAALTEDLVLEAAMTGRRVTNYVEVQLKVHWANDHDAPVLVQQWRAEREDGVILSFGQEQIFKRLLPAGKYKVEVRAQREANSPLLAARGVLTVSSREAAIQPFIARK